MIGNLLNLFNLAKNTTSMQMALKRCSRRNLSVGTVIDVGASDGRWSLMAKKYFPDAFYFLIEAQSGHEMKLRNFKNNHRNVEYILAAAGDSDGSIYFDDSDLFGGLASHSPLETGGVSVPMWTIDTLVRTRELKPPFVLKLDTHGFEVPIFQGAHDTLNESSLIIVEAYNFKLTNDSLKFHEMCSFMETKGFSCIDIADPMYRPNDRAFWQIDLFFIRKDSKEFESNSYE